MARTRFTPACSTAAPTTSSISCSLRIARAARWGTGMSPASAILRAAATVPSKPALGSHVMKTGVPSGSRSSMAPIVLSSRGVTSMLNPRINVAICEAISSRSGIRVTASGRS